MAEELKYAGFNGGWTDVRTKLDNLTRKYRAEKSKIGPSGGTPSCWNHYEKVHMILGGLRMHDVNTEPLSNTNFVEVMNDPILFDQETSTCSTESSVSRSTEGSSAKRARIDTQAALIDLYEKVLGALRQSTRNSKRNSGRQ
ncbi:hypothetical protein ACLKA7_001945 [Drosophila subpalustris]